MERWGPYFPRDSQKIIIDCTHLMPQILVGFYHLSLLVLQAAAVAAPEGTDVVRKLVIHSYTL